MKNVSVIGLGRVGLPFALILTEQGYQVTGIDINTQLLNSIRHKIPPFLEEGCQSYLDRFVGCGFEVTSDFSGIAEADYIVVTVGTPVDDNLNPVIGDLLNVMDRIGPNMRSGQTVILRSTMSPRTTERIGQHLSQISGLVVDKDLFIACCPERIAEGKAFRELKTIPQIVGGVGEASTRQARSFFEPLGVEVLPTDALSAEISKLFTNMFRYIEFAIANEFFMLAEKHGRNFLEIRKLVNHGYQRGGLAAAGLTAGPCLFKDGFFLLDDVPFTDLITNSWRINENLPNFLLNLIDTRYSVVGRHVALLGMAFKGDSDDTRQSLSFRMRKLLQAKGAIVHEHDPYVSRFSTYSLEEVVTQSSVSIIAAPHSLYRESLPQIFARHQTLVCDIWNLCGQNQVFFMSDDVDLMSSASVVEMEGR